MREFRFNHCTMETPGPSEDCSVVQDPLSNTNPAAKLAPKLVGDRTLRGYRTLLVASVNRDSFIRLNKSPYLLIRVPY